MKKAIVTLCIIVMTAMTAFADGGKDKGDFRHLISRPTQNWFIDASVTCSFFQSNDFVLSDFGPIRGPFVGGSARIGKMIAPTLGFRVAYDYHPCKNHNEATVGYFSYKNAHFDMLFGPLDLFNKYKTDRVYRLYLYEGIGLMGYDDDVNKLFITNSSALEFGFDFGIINSFRLSRSLDFHIDLQATVTRWSFDEFQTPYAHRNHTDLEAMAGLTWFIGGRIFEVANLADAVSADCSDQENTINELNGRIKTLENQLANCGENIITHDTIVKIVNGEAEVITYPLSIFFNKGSYELRDARDRINLQEIAQAAIDHNLKVNLRGSCDAATASAAFNKTLAQNRCNKIKDELVKIGVPADNIIIDAVGAVTELKPAEYDRRVFIQFSK